MVLCQGRDARFFEHIRRSVSESVGKRVLRSGLPGRRSKGRLKRRFSVVKEDMGIFAVSEENAKG